MMTGFGEQRQGQGQLQWNEFGESLLLLDCLVIELIIGLMGLPGAQGRRGNTSWRPHGAWREKRSANIIDVHGTK